MTKQKNRMQTLAKFFNEITQYADEGAEIKLSLENPDGNGWGWGLTITDAEQLEMLCVHAARRGK